LVAEDDEGHFSLIRKNLFRMGFRSRVLRFADGQEVLDFMFGRGEGPKREDDKNYLLLLDIRMPNVDGVEVLRQLKADERLRKIPVVVLTNVNEGEAVEQCRKLGCVDYIVKPIDSVGFVQTIHKVGLSLLLSVVEMSHLGGTSPAAPAQPS